MADSDLTDIIDIQYETQEKSGISVPVKERSAILGGDELLALDSYPTVPAFRVNVPEIKEVKAKFVYNFFPMRSALYY